MVTVKKLVLYFVDICSLVQKTISRFLAGRSRFFVRAVSICGSRKNNKSGAKRGARAKSLPGPQTKVNAMLKRTFPKKKLK